MQTMSNETPSWFKQKSHSVVSNVNWMQILPWRCVPKLHGSVYFVKQIWKDVVHTRVLEKHFHMYLKILTVSIVD